MTEWTSDDLEPVPSCPVCGGLERRLLYDRLTDRTWGIAPGVWTLQSCGSCGSAFLDPRPTPATIGRAYSGGYYTHGSEAAPADPMKPGLAGRLRRLARNGYLNRQYGYRFSPASGALGLVMAALPPLQHDADYWVRHLSHRGDGRLLLDIGCGTGAYLTRMSALGWATAGLEPDSDAARACPREIPIFRTQLAPGVLPDATYDAITMSHVIEHLHDPHSALRCCFEVLRPGGTLWLATPRLNSPVHKAYGRYWYALDAPRHLVLFTADALEFLLRRTGYVSVQRLPGRRRSSVDLIAQSNGVVMRDQIVPQSSAAPFMSRWRRLAIGFGARLFGSGEELVYRCRKPDPARLHTAMSMC